MAGGAGGSGVVIVRYLNPSVSDGVPPGGTAGQVLAKKSSTDFDTEFIDPPSGVSQEYVDEIVTVDTAPPTEPPARDGLLWVVVAP
jgi:hypothetical protein